MVDRRKPRRAALYRPASRSADNHLNAAVRQTPRDNFRIMTSACVVISAGVLAILL